MSFPAYFAHQSAASRYARYRPDVHPEFAARIAAAVGPRRLAVDAGAGTGQSARALAAVAGRVVGVDPSAEMLAAADPHPAVAYVRGRAEALPVAGGAADLVVAALAFHWFDHEAFLTEARRVLGPGGRLVIYASWFRAEMAGEPGFHDWFTGTHLARFPTPPRSRVRLDADLGTAHGFGWGGDEALDQEVTFNHEQLVGYLLTQTNVIAAVEHGDRELEGVAAELLAATAPFFSTRGEGSFRFGGRSAYLSIA